MKKLNFETTTYDIGNGFRLDIERRKLLISAWIWHEHYGVKSFIIGEILEFTTEKAFIESVMEEIDESIAEYMEQYMDLEEG